MILKAKETVGFMPRSVIVDYGISPVDEKDSEGNVIKDEKVWPKTEHGFCIVKGEEYNLSKEHPFFESVGKLHIKPVVKSDKNNKEE